MTVKLQYKRDALVKALNDRLEERKQKRQEKQDEVDARNKEARDRIVALLDEFPEFLVYLNGCVEAEFGESATHDDLNKEVAKAYGHQVSAQGVPEHDPDENLKRLIRVYEAAADDTIELEEQDPVLKFL